MTHGGFLRWLVATGDRVMMGQPLCEVEADDGIYEIENFDYGIVTTMPVEVGRYPVGTVLGYIEFTGEERMAQEFFRERLMMDRLNVRLARDFPSPYRMMAGERCHRCREPLQALSDGLPLCLRCFVAYKGEAIRAALHGSVFAGVRVAMDRLGWSLNDANHLVAVMLTPGG